MVCLSPPVPPISPLPPQPLNFVEVHAGYTLPEEVLVPKRFVEEYPRGNVRRYNDGTTVCIEADSADKIKLGRRYQRKGLLYDERFGGFEPLGWPHVVAPRADGGVGSCRLVLQPLEGEEEESTLVDICYDPRSDDRLLGWAEAAMAEHVPCRIDEGSQGAMVGVGDHLLRDGRLVHYKTEGEASRRRISNMMEGAGRAFQKHFGGREVGFAEMLHEQQRLWPPRRHPIGWPLCWDASRNLGNPAHIDHDGWRCYAWWGRTGSGSGSWWLLFPMWGVAIYIEHGTWISWDGRCQGHCTAVPNLAEGDHFYSLFCSLPANLLSVRERVVSCAATMHARSAGEGVRGAELFHMLRVGMRVTYRTAPIAPAEILTRGKGAIRQWVKAHTRWALAKVSSITETHVQLKDESSAASTSWLSISDVSNRLVIRE
jgi:hypothetical protein